MDTVILDLANPEQALGLYLDALLRETPLRTAEVTADRALARVSNATVPATTPRAPSVLVEVPVANAEPVPVRTRDIPAVAEPVVATPAQTTAPPDPVQKRRVRVVSEATPTVTPAAAPAVAPTAAPAAAPVPTEPFQSLLFQVAGLTVAVPLVELNAILRYPERLAAVPGLPSWGLGVVRHRDRNVVVVDSIDLFVPENLREASRSRSKPRYLVVLGGGRFGLACDTVDQVVSLNPGEVRWRGERGRRPWLAGTVKERLCALLEVPALVRLLKAGHLEEPNS